MATVVNTTGAERRSGAGWIVPTLLLLLAIFLFFYYGLPALRGAANQGAGGATINVPEQVDVNVNQPAAPTE